MMKLHVKTKGMLNSLISKINSREKKPLIERKSNPSSKNSTIIKLPANDLFKKSFAPDNSNTTNLKSYLKINSRKSKENSKNMNFKSKSIYPNPNDLSGISNNSVKVGPRNFKFSSKKELSKTYRKTNTFNRPSKENNLNPPKNLSNYNLSNNTLNNPNIRCITSRDKGLKPNNLGNDIPLKPGNSIEIPGYEAAKYSIKSHGIIEAYAVNTNQGIVRYWKLLSIGTIMKTVYQLYSALLSQKIGHVNLGLNVHSLVFTMDMVVQVALNSFVTTSIST